MSIEIKELIPFKVELMKFEDLGIDSEFYKHYRTYDASNMNFLHQLSRSRGTYLKEEEYKDKMCELNPFRKAFEETYTDWANQFPGEWIVVGKIGEFYLAAQPKKIARMLPIECCRFVGLL